MAATCAGRSAAREAGLAELILPRATYCNTCGNATFHVHYSFSPHLGHPFCVRLVGTYLLIKGGPEKAVECLESWGHRAGTGSSICKRCRGEGPRLTVMDTLFFKLQYDRQSKGQTGKKTEICRSATRGMVRCA